MPAGRRTIQFIADRGDARLRLDQILVRRVTEVTRMSRSRAQQWIESGAVSVNGSQATRPAVRVREGASVEVALPETSETRQRPEAAPGELEIIHEDEHLIAVNKPAGIVVHPSYKNATGTLLSTLLWHLRDRDGVRPGLVSRLDKQTSGLLLVALSADVHARLQRTAIAKEYLAVVAGTPRPSRGTIDLPLARDPADRRRVVVVDGGAHSITRYEVLASDDEVSLVRCELVTGRTHQIRVHLAAIGSPVLGDAVYGAADPRIPRQALHAWRATFVHPITGAALQLTAPIPHDVAAVVPHGDSR